MDRISNVVKDTESKWNESESNGDYVERADDLDTETSPLLGQTKRERLSKCNCKLCLCVSAVVIVCLLLIVMPIAVYLVATSAVKLAQDGNLGSGTLKELIVHSINDSGITVTADVVVDLNIDLPSQISVKTAFYDFKRQHGGREKTEVAIAQALVDGFTIQKGEQEFPLALDAFVHTINATSTGQFAQQVLDLKEHSPKEHWHVLGNPIVHWKFLDIPFSVDKIVKFNPSEIFETNLDWNASLNGVEMHPAFPNYGFSVDADFNNPLPLTLEAQNLSVSLNISYLQSDIATVNLPLPLGLGMNRNAGFVFDGVLYPYIVSNMNKLIDRYMAGKTLSFVIYGFKVRYGSSEPVAWLEQILDGLNFEICVQRPKSENGAFSSLFEQILRGFASSSLI